MANGFIVSEEKPDREYFTIVPNYIINHSTIWERDIYLIMKRIAGEKGNCYASHQTIAEKTGVSRPTISRTIQKLLKRGWIKETGKVPGKTHPTKNYVIVDLWAFNSEHYKDEKKRKPQNQSIKNTKDTSTTERKKRKPQMHKEENIEEDISLSKDKEEFGNSSVNKGMEILTTFFGYKPSMVRMNRYALNRLFRSKGEDRTFKAMEFALSQQNNRFCPVVTSYMDLEQKWSALEVYARRELSGPKKGGVLDATNL